MSRLSEILEDSIDRNRSVSRPHLPYGENTSRVKDPCSISTTRCPYARFFSLSQKRFEATVRRSEWVENPNIEECSLAPLPETSNAQI